MIACDIEKLLIAPRTGCIFNLDCATKFFNCIYIFGWFHCENDRLERVTLVCNDKLYDISEIGIPHGGVEKLGPKKGFKIQAILSTDKFPDDAILIFETQRITFAAKLVEITANRIMPLKSSKPHERFINYLATIKNPCMLDVGGRDRSKLDRSQFFPNVNVTVLDILSGNNVDVVGDAHCLSKYFPVDYFDAIYSICVFEHLLMPWKVVLEMNKILKKGGIVFIYTHQTIGMHDIPWDFFRFSDNAWPALFNKKTGFEIMETVMELEQFILPFIYRPGKIDAEKAAGFEGSCVLVRKTAEAMPEWNIELSEIIRTIYPDTEEKIDPKNALLI